MKKLFFLAVVAILTASCGSSARLMNTSTHKEITFQPVAAVIADLRVSPDKITHFMMPSKTVANGGYDNIIDSAVREALQVNGNADVLVALETQIKYSDSGEIESITVSGYPAKYCNFRSPDDSFWTSEVFVDLQSRASSSASGTPILSSFLSMGKKK